jgi:hypothetical protein
MQRVAQKVAGASYKTVLRIAEAECIRLRPRSVSSSGLLSIDSPISGIVSRQQKID